ncbi:MAG: twin-arginine translocase TatA/TatE family subunit [Dehalococcoidia bacterium]|nr:twin-arginine translocase TatA/TatE family subunit [Dehalococcoidia bacterium]
MEFLGVGYQEIFLVLVLLLVFVGPERLPGMAYQIGRAVRTMQQYARAVRNEFSDEFAYIEEQYKTVKGQVDDTRQALRDEDRKLQAELRDATAVDLPPLLPPDTPSANGAAATPDAAPPATAAGEGTAPAAPAEPPAGEQKPPAPPMVF